MIDATAINNKSISHMMRKKWISERYTVSLKYSWDKYKVVVYDKIKDIHSPNFVIISHCPQEVCIDSNIIRIRHGETYSLYEISPLGCIMHMVDIYSVNGDITEDSSVWCPTGDHEFYKEYCLRLAMTIVNVVH